MCLFSLTKPDSYAMEISEINNEIFLFLGLVEINFEK